MQMLSQLYSVTSVTSFTSVTCVTSVTCEKSICPPVRQLGRLRVVHIVCDLAINSKRQWLPVVAFSSDGNVASTACTILDAGLVWDVSGCVTSALMAIGQSHCVNSLVWRVWTSVTDAADARLEMQMQTPTSNMEIGVAPTKTLCQDMVHVM